MVASLTGWNMFFPSQIHRWRYGCQAYPGSADGSSLGSLELSNNIILKPAAVDVRGNLEVNYLGIHIFSDIVWHHKWLFQMIFMGNTPGTVKQAMVSLQRLINCDDSKFPHSHRRHSQCKESFAPNHLQFNQFVGHLVFGWSKMVRLIFDDIYFQFSQQAGTLLVFEFPNAFCRSSTWQYYYVTMSRF